MKVICSWCRETIGYVCDHCGEPLTEEKLQGGGTVLICRNGMTAIVHSSSIAQHQSHGMCKQCAALTEPERAELVRIQREQRAQEEHANRDVWDRFTGKLNP